MHVHRNVTPATYETLSHAIDIANACHGIRRMANPIEGYRLLPAQPGRNYWIVCVYTDDPINFLIGHFIKRYTCGPVHFLMYRRVSGEGYSTLENAIVLRKDIPLWLRGHFVILKIYIKDNGMTFYINFIASSS